MDPGGHAREVEAAVRAHGLRAARVVPLTVPDPRKRGRSAWRVELAGGGAVKARRLESAAAADELIALRDGLDDAFAPPLGRDGPVLLERWIDGAPLDAAQADARAAEAGALLGRLHARPLRGEHAAAVSTASTAYWRGRAERNLDDLAAAGALPADVVAALREDARRLDPGTARAALVHRDFCAENMVVDAAGRLHVIDNEWFTIDAAGLDLGRTLYRWPMSEAGRCTFLASYRDACACDPGPLDFWHLVAVLWSAGARLDHRPEQRAIPLAAARALAESGLRRNRRAAQ
jgi:Ser/Thr protein kinase RdoA (MazF antagonist)